MIDVTLVLPSLQGGGAERVTLTLAEGLSHLGLKIQLLVFNLDGAFANDLPPNVEVIDLGTGSNSEVIAKLAFHLIRNRPRVILSALVNADQAVAIVAPILRIPCFIAIHNTMSQAFRDVDNPKVAARAARIRKLYRRVSGLIACGKGAATDADHFLGLAPGTVVPINNPAISQRLFELAKHPVEHQWFTPEYPPVIVSVGRLTWEKDFSNLVKAFSVVKKERDCRLLILGEGADRQSLEALIDSLGLTESVSMPGFCSNPYAILSKSAMFVLSSCTEGLPTVLIEALACGTPVVSTNCPNGPDEILHGGKYGRLVPIEDAEALASAMIQTLDAPIKPSVESWGPFEALEVCQEYRKILLKH